MKADKNSDKEKDNPENGKSDSPNPPVIPYNYVYTIIKEDQPTKTTDDRRNKKLDPVAKATYVLGLITLLLTIATFLLYHETVDLGRTTKEGIDTADANTKRSLKISEISANAAKESAALNKRLVSADIISVDWFPDEQEGFPVATVYIENRGKLAPHRIATCIKAWVAPSESGIGDTKKFLTDTVEFRDNPYQPARIPVRITGIKAKNWNEIINELIGTGNRLYFCGIIIFWDSDDAPHSSHFEMEYFPTKGAFARYGQKEQRGP